MTTYLVLRSEVLRVAAVLHLLVVTLWRMRLSRSEMWAVPAAVWRAWRHLTLTLELSRHVWCTSWLVRQLAVVWSRRGHLTKSLTLVTLTTAVGGEVAVHVLHVGVAGVAVGRL